MTKIDNIEFPFDIYEKIIESSIFYRSKSHSLTVYTGFESKNNNGTYILKIRDKLEIYLSDSLSPFDMICNLEGKHSTNAFNTITWNGLSGFEQGLFLGA